MIRIRRFIAVAYLFRACVLVCFRRDTSDVLRWSPVRRVPLLISITRVTWTIAWQPCPKLRALQTSSLDY